MIDFLEPEHLFDYYSDVDLGCRKGVRTELDKIVDNLHNLYIPPSFKHEREVGHLQEQDQEWLRVLLAKLLQIRRGTTEKKDDPLHGARIKWRQLLHWKQHIVIYLDIAFDKEIAKSVACQVDSALDIVMKDRAFMSVEETDKKIDGIIAYCNEAITPLLGD